jgi:hypothetical protein
MMFVPGNVCCTLLSASENSCLGRLQLTAARRNHGMGVRADCCKHSCFHKGAFSIDHPESSMQASNLKNPWQHAEHAVRNQIAGVTADLS